MVVIAFLVPLGILVSALAFDRAVTRAERDAVHATIQERLLRSIDIKQQKPKKLVTL